MIFDFDTLECLPEVIDDSFRIADLPLLVQYVGEIVLGHYAHVELIMEQLASDSPIAPVSSIDAAIERIQNDGKVNAWQKERRDGWLFQIISWLALRERNSGKKYASQPPHDAPGQHGLDGLALILNGDDTIDSIIITEDKCTVNHRQILHREVWTEFKQFEAGLHENKVMTRVSPLIVGLAGRQVLSKNQNDIYKTDLRRYRVGINRLDKHSTLRRRTKLFAGYDTCVLGDTPHKRYASTFLQADIRSWMNDFSDLIVTYIESKRP